MPDLSKVGFSEGPEIDSQDTQDPNVSIGRLIETIDKLQGSLSKFDDIASQKYINEIKSLQATTESSFLQGASQTRGVHEQLTNNPALQVQFEQNFNNIKQLMDEHHLSVKQMYEQMLNTNPAGNTNLSPKPNTPKQPKPKEDKTPKKHWLEWVIQDLHAEVQKYSHPLTHHLGHEFSKTFHADSAGTQYAVTQLTNIGIKTTESFTESATSVLQLKGAFESLALLGGSLFLGVAGLGISSALEAIDIDENYRKMIFQSNPAAFESISGSMGDKMSFREDMISSLIGVKSDEQADALYQSALSTRPGTGTTDQTVEGMALEIGMLQDLGIDKGATSSVLTNLQHNLGMKAPEAMGTVAGLTKTGINENLDIANYLGQVSEIGTRFRGMGVTVAQVDSVFTKFMGKTFTGGTKLAADQAIGLTELQFGLQKRLSATTAGLIGLSQGADLNVLPSTGLAGGSNIGQMMHSGDPILAYAATQMIRQGANISGMYDSIATHYQNMAKMQNPNASHDEQMGRLYLMMQKEGSIQGDFSDPKVRALLDEILTHKKGSDKLKEKFAAIAPKSLPDMFRDLQEKTLIPELQGFYKNIEERANPLEGLGKLWQKIRQMLAGIFLPSIEEISTIIAALGSFTKTFFESKGNLLSASHSFSDKFVEVQHEWQHANKMGTLNAIIEQNSLTKQFLGKLGLLETEEPNQAFQEKIGEIVAETALTTKYLLQGVGDTANYAASELLGVNNKLAGGNKLYRDKYEGVARAAAQKYGIPEQLFVNQITQESGWNPLARSGAGAVGIAQIVPRWHPGVNASDANESLDYAAKLMKGHYLTYKKKGYDDKTAYALALSAYNAGAGNVEKYGTGIYKGGLAETTNYVKNIMGGSTPNFGSSMANLSHAEDGLMSSLSTNNVHKQNINHDKNIQIKAVVNTTVKNKAGKVVGQKQITKIVT